MKTTPQGKVCATCLFRDSMTTYKKDVPVVHMLCCIECTDTKSLNGCYEITRDVLDFIHRYGCNQYKPVKTTLKIGDEL